MIEVLIALLLIASGGAPTPQGPGQRQPPSAPPPKTSHQEPRPRMAGSPTGYVEDATVSSKIRLRFDAALGVNAPDRAEFFYAKCGCYRGLPPKDPFYDPNAPGPGPDQVAKLNFQELYVDAEYAPSRRFSVFAEIPFRSIQFHEGMSGSQTGLSDFRAGLKVALLSSDTHYLTAQLRSYVPTGSALAGLGTNHVSYEPSLLYFQRIGTRGSISGQFGGWIPVDTSAGVTPQGVTTSKGFGGNILIYGAGVGYTALKRESVAVTPVVEFVGWSVRGGAESTSSGPISSAGTSIANGKIGARIAFSPRNSIYVGVGHNLTHAIWYRDLFRLEYRYLFH